MTVLHMTVTKSFRLEESLINEIDEICGKQGCNRNDWVKNALENQLELESATENEGRPPSKGIITKISHDDGKTWEDVRELENVKVVEI